MASSEIILNDERFTHLLSLHELLLKQNKKSIDNFCKNDLFSTLNNNHILFSNTLFFGMHHLLHQIDIYIINDMKKVLSINDETVE